MTLINDLTTLVQALLQVTPPTVGANAEPAKREHEKEPSKKMIKKEGGGGAGGGPRNSETSATLLAILSTLSIFRRSPNYATRIFSQRKIGGTCFYVGAETLSLEYPFPNTPKSGAMMHAASAASGAAGDADSEKSNKLVSEKVNKSCTRKLLKKLTFVLR